MAYCIDLLTWLLTCDNIGMGTICVLHLHIPNIPALLVLYFHPHYGRFEDLRIRRETKSRNVKEGGRRADKPKPGRNDKTACLLFTATLQIAKGHEIVLTKLSRPIHLCKYVFWPSMVHCMHAIVFYILYMPSEALYMRFDLKTISACTCRCSTWGSWTGVASPRVWPRQWGWEGDHQRNKDDIT